MTDIHIDTSDFEGRMSNIERLLIMQTEVAGDHIAEDVEHKTFPYVPLLHGYLQDSGKIEKKSPPPHLEMEITYSAKSNKGYDYAARQHEEILNHPIKGTDHYLSHGLHDSNVTQLFAFHIASVL